MPFYYKVNCLFFFCLVETFIVAVYTLGPVNSYTLQRGSLNVYVAVVSSTVSC